MPEERLHLRRHRAVAIFDELETWLHAQFPKIPGKSELAKATRYALTRLPRLRPHLENGCLEIDNNCSERSIKPMARGRKNHLFVGSEGTARAQRLPTG